VAPVAKLKQSAAEIKSAARRIALVLMILSPGAVWIAIIVENSTYGSLKNYCIGL
jgi:hypothetical protein